MDSYTTAQSCAGYSHRLYAESLKEFGEPLYLPDSGASLLKRSIHGHFDAMGPYPLLSCSNWGWLGDELDALRGELVSVAAVPDPFGDYDRQLIEESFDNVIEFKPHLIVDLSQGYGIRSHRYHARRAAKDVRVDICDPGELIEDWLRLYDSLIDRHSIKGIKAFSHESFRRQFDVPGLVCVRAGKDGVTVGAMLWFVHDDVAYSHLAATSECGYKLRCPYAIYAAALEHFSGKVRFADLGGGSGTSAVKDGLTVFKEGWANDSRPAYFCSSILDPQRYMDLTAATGNESARYFPAYRNGELA